MTDIFQALFWYLIISIIGVIALPVSHRFFNKLPSAGITLARPLGLLIWAYFFWLGTSVGILRNDIGGEVFALLALCGIAFFVFRRDKNHDLIHWLKCNRKTIISAEIVFFLAFCGWVIVRGMNPEAAYTEKPMELAFINAILRSPGFPPQDPWLSGYAISYYYFGYVMVAMLARISGAAASVAFNLSSALWFALTAAASYGIVFDLTAVWKNRLQHTKGQNDLQFSRIAGFLGPLYLLLISTIEGVLEVLHAKGFFWKLDLEGSLSSRFWTWLSIRDLNVPPDPPFSWMPNRGSGWLWWRGSRVLQDLSLTNDHIEVIDEFPFFTYLLADLHPHLLNMPFVLLAVAVSLNFFLGSKEFFDRFKNIQGWFRSPSSWLVVLIFGSLSFINTWDFPIYVGLFCLVWLYNRYQLYGWQRQHFWEFIRNGLILGITGGLIFIPFYLGFDSQAGGILPSLEYMTKGIHFWILFGALLVPVLGWLIHSNISTFGKRNLLTGFRTALIGLTGSFVLMFVYGAILYTSLSIGPSLAGSANAVISSLGERISAAGIAFGGVHGNYPANDVLRASVIRRLVSPGTWITLFLMLGLVFAGLINKKVRVDPVGDDGTDVIDTQADMIIPYVLLLTLVAILLVGFPEFFYLRDQFGTRMNTIFKFYFQGWMLFSIVAAFASATLIYQLKRIKGGVFRFVWIVSLLAGLAYPVIMLYEKTNGFSFTDWTLDGNAFVQRYNPDDYAAIEWLQSAPRGVISEAVGGSYSDYARVSTRSGQQTVLGWPGHESQWRGGGEEMGTRMGDIQNLYECSTWSEAEPILQRYRIRYIYLGNLEHAIYNVDEGKFMRELAVVYQNQGTVIYEYPQPLGEKTP